MDFSIDTGYTSLSTRESNGSGTLHYIYSITKTFVAAAVLQLVEEGKLTLNTTVGDILPEVEFDPVYINTSATVITDALELLGKSSWTAGGMVSRAEDIARWGYELYSRNAVVSPAIRDKMLDSVSRFSQSDKEAYGYGIRKIYHNSASLVGSYGRSIGSENCMFYNPNKDTCYVILTSSNTSKDRTPNIDQLLFSLQETTP